MKKHEHEHDHDDDEEEEEKKMEMFYSLIRTFKEARDRRKKELEEMERSNKKRKLHCVQTPSSSSSFECQDFVVTFPNQHQFLPLPQLNHKKPENPEHEEQEGYKEHNEQEEDKDLNLKLSL